MRRRLYGQDRHRPRLSRGRRGSRPRSGRQCPRPGARERRADGRHHGLRARPAAPCGDCLQMPQGGRLRSADRGRRRRRRHLRHRSARNRRRHVSRPRRRAGGRARGRGAALRRRTDARAARARNGRAAGARPALRPRRSAPQIRRRRHGDGKRCRLRHRGHRRPARRWRLFHKDGVETQTLVYRSGTGTVRRIGARRRAQPRL